MLIVVHIVNAFVDGEIGGNPAGVVLDADKLSLEDKLSIAAQVGVSETAFVSPSKSATFKLDFFTPVRQIAHCGHATIATFSLLRQRGIVADGLLSKETIDGNREISVKDGSVFMEQRAPTYTQLDSGETSFAFASLGLDMPRLAGDFRPVIVNTGNSFLLVPFENESAVRELRPDYASISQFSSEHDLIGYYAYSRTAEDKGRDATTRMFAPRFGIEEESATGMAAGPLACFLYDRGGIKKARLLIEQGKLMNPSSPSVITADLDIRHGQISRLMVGGNAKLMRSVSLEI